MSVELLPAIKGGPSGCVCCPPIPGAFCLQSRIAVGFGAAYLECDGKEIWSEGPNMEWDDCMSGEQAEALAAADPDHDWRILIHGPLSGRTFQRHAPGQWMLIEKNMGFA